MAPVPRRIGAILATLLVFAGVGLFSPTTPGATAQPSAGLGHNTAQPSAGLGHNTAQPSTGLDHNTAQPSAGLGDRGEDVARASSQRSDRLRFDIAELSPRVVQEGDEQLTISGSITNTSDRRIDDLVGRVELGNRLANDQQAWSALRGPLSRHRSTSRFTQLSGSLQPGESASVNLEVPLDGSPQGLAIPRPGVYPLLVNVNGTPESGSTARLVAFNLLLPVRAAPGGDGPPPEDERDDPLHMALLWPIAARQPRVVRDVHGKPLLLSDDVLASSLAPGGRLDGLVSSASEAMQRGELSNSICFAIDPALLSTVKRMTNGYRVRTGNGQVSGEGAKHAERWLSDLRDLVDGHCVIQVSSAGANLNNLTRVGSGEQDQENLVSLATQNADTVEKILGVKPRQDALWPAGDLSGAALSAVARAGVSQLVASATQFPDSVTDPIGTSGIGIRDSDLRAQTFDALLHHALRAPGDSPDIAAQNGIGALLLRIRQERPGDTDPVVVAPPQRWNAAPEELGTFLHTLENLAADEEIEPVPVEEMLNAQPTETVSVDSRSTASVGNVSSDGLSQLRRINQTATKLARAMTVDATSLVRPDELVGRLRRGILRVLSTAWRDSASERASALRDAQQQVEAITSQVTVKPPPQPIALASDDSPLPVYISNKLPVTITVGVAIRNNRALRHGDIPYQEIPANSSRNRNVNIEPLRAGRISATVLIKTPQGIQLGESTRFELTSTEYGTITLVVTGVAGAALLLLSSRRIYRRLRTRKARE